jgi:hypothetical protein
MRNGIFRSELECLLTEHEIKTYSGELARLTQSQAELEDRKKEVSADYKARIDACISQTRVIARKVSSGKEMKDVEVRWNYDYLANVKVLERLDTLEIIDTKALTENERQMCLNLEEKANEEDPIEDDEPIFIEETGEISQETFDSLPTGNTEGLCIILSEEVPCTACGNCQEETQTGTDEPPFECLNCVKKKKAKKCGADCRQI